MKRITLDQTVAELIPAKSIQLFNKKAFNRKKLSHYTNIEVLKLISQNKSIKLNRIDNVNDLMEKNYLGEESAYSSYFISSFTYRQDESIPQWFMYTKNTKGIRLTFNFKSNLGSNAEGFIDLSRPLELYDSNHNKLHSTLPPKEYKGFYYDQGTFHNYVPIHIHTCDIFYTNDYVSGTTESFTNGSVKLHNTTYAAKTKSILWDFEQETRIIGKFRPVKEVEIEIPDYMLLPISFDALSSITITCNPWITRSERYQLNKIIKQLPCSINIENSILHKLIKKKEQ